jgi:N6-L-threonylcarbamoyladenine synthase
MLVLAIETSCDETSVAVVQNGCVQSNLVSSQIKLHAEYGGVVPELASREHLRNLLPLAREAMGLANVVPNQLDAVAVTQGPGLPNALMVGFRAAQGLAFCLRRPLIGINHHEAHLYSAWVAGDPPQADFKAFEPCVALIVSGGHTLLVLVQAELEHRLLGSTLDDAAGECFDKIAKLIGLPYPGGPEIDRLAERGNPAAFAFPRPMIRDANDDFSFSGLKTAVRYFLRDHAELLRSAQGIYDICASAQAAIVEVLVAKTISAAKRWRVSMVTSSGGVACNRAFRRDLAKSCDQVGFRLRLAARSFCTDNAGMIGILAERRLLHGGSKVTFPDDILANWLIK